MKRLQLMFSFLLSLPFLTAPAWAEPAASQADNAALRYWSAFAQVQDSAITAQEAKDLRAIVDDAAPYNEAEFRDLLRKNEFALTIMSRGTELSTCTWGLDYALGENLPVEYALKALVLGRINILNIDHLFATGDKQGGIRAIATGLRFSRDVGNGGSFFAMLVAKSLLLAHLRIMGEIVHGRQISAQQRLLLRDAVEQVQGGLDWSSAARLELESLRTHYAGNPAEAAAIDRIIPLYLQFLKSPSFQKPLKAAIATLPPQVAKEVPNPLHISEQRKELDDYIFKMMSMLRHAS